MTHSTSPGVTGDTSGDTSGETSGGIAWLRAGFYIVVILVTATMSVALTAPRHVGDLLGSSYPGMVAIDRPWWRILSDPFILLWLSLGVVAVCFSIIALTVSRRRNHDAIPERIYDTSRASRWRQVYSLRTLLIDLASTLWAALGAQIIWFGAAANTVGIGAGMRIPYGLISLAVCTGWLLTLHIFGSRDPLVYGEGVSEYRRVMSASFTWFGLVAIAALLIKIDFARGYVLLAFPLGTLSLFIGRRTLRKWLIVKRARESLYMTRALVIGSPLRVASVVNEMRSDPAGGYFVVAVALPSGEEAPSEIQELEIPAVPYPQAIDTMRELRADTLVVAGGKDITAESVRELSWELQPGLEHLVLSPALLDIAGPRISTRPVAGLSLINVSTPRFSGNAQVLKRTFDIFCSGVGLLLLAIPFAGIAIAIKTTSKGPVFFRQKRVGFHGSEFKMWKFRSMIVDAEAQLAKLQATQDAGNSVLFKMKDDPRITSIGKWLRRFSIDELPQLINVFCGSMSLVGPRPPLEQEVESYTPTQMSRRFLVKPGITGLWQVNGRSDLDWDESIRLDLYYVENWSVLSDLQILLRTVRVVFAGEGAY